MLVTCSIGCTSHQSLILYIVAINIYNITRSNRGTGDPLQCCDPWLSCSWLVRVNAESDHQNDHESGYTDKNGSTVIERDCWCAQEVRYKYLVSMKKLRMCPRTHQSPWPPSHGLCYPSPTSSLLLLVMVTCCCLESSLWHCHCYGGHTSMTMCPWSTHYQWSWPVSWGWPNWL